MISVITGDIINSRGKNPEIWINTLKKALHTLNPNSSQWEIYRGDSFQIEITDPAESFLAAVYIKACIKIIKGLDVRLAIGVGNKSYQGEDITESNGEAFIYSGETFESLKKEKTNLKIKTASLNLNEEFNLYFRLALIAMDNWTVNSSEAIKITIENYGSLQSEIAQIIGINQDAISKRLKRAYFKEIMDINRVYNRKLTLLK